jgi:hypothetical protein
MLKPLRYFFLRVYEFKLRSEPEGLAALTALCATSVAVFCQRPRHRLRDPQLPRAGRADYLVAK